MLDTHHGSQAPDMGGFRSKGNNKGGKSFGKNNQFLFQAPPGNGNYMQCLPCGPMQMADPSHFCGCCGRYGHFRRDCPHQGKQCNICGSWNHVANGCNLADRNRGKEGQKAPGGKGKDGGKAKGKGTKGDAPNNQGSTTKAEDALKESWKCSGCFAVSFKMAAKSCASCGLARKQLNKDERKAKLQLNKREKEVLKRHKGKTAEDDSNDDAKDCDMDSDGFAMDAEDSDNEEAAPKQRPEETDEDFRRRKKANSLKKAIRQLEEDEEWAEAAELKKKLKDLPKGERLRATRDKASIHSLIYDRRNHEEATLEKLADQKKEVKTRQEKAKKERARELKAMKERHEEELRRHEQEWEDLEARTTGEIDEIDLEAEQVAQETQDIVTSLEEALDRAERIEEERAAEEPPREEEKDVKEWKSVVVGGTSWKRTRVVRASEQAATAPSETIIRSTNFNEDEFRQKLLDRGLDSGDIDIFLEAQSNYLNSKSEALGSGGTRN